jgi:hypothetical protein
MPAKISDVILRPLVEEAVANNWPAQTVSDTVWRRHNIRVCVRTVRRRIKEWDLKQRGGYDGEDVKDAVLANYKQSLNQKRSLIALKNERDINISRSTLARLEKKLNLHRQKDDIDLGVVTYAALCNKIEELQNEYGHVLGIKSVKKKLALEHELHIHR